MTTLYEVAAKLTDADPTASATSSPFNMPASNSDEIPATLTRATSAKKAKAPHAPQKPADRRQHRRHEMDHQDITVDRWDGARRSGATFGRIMDLSAGGVRIRTENADNIRPDNQIRVRLELPDYAGISPFVDTAAPEGMKPKREWVGWMAVTRVKPVSKQHVDVAGRLVDMDEIDRGMLGLYLSTQPLAA
jgi:hypothetical protein